MTLSMVNYTGGKARGWREILNWFPRNYDTKDRNPYGFHRYLEVFGGGASVLLNIPRAPVEMYNDLDKGMYAIVRCLIDDTLTTQLLTKIDLAIHSRNLFDWMKNEWEPTNIVDLALRKYCLIRMSYGGMQKNWRTHNQGFRRPSVLYGDYLVSVVERLQSVQVENLDYREFFKKYRSSEEKTDFAFLDPPYPEAMDKNIYQFNEMDYTELKETLDNWNGKWLMTITPYPEIREIFSDYNHSSYEIYHHLKQKWVKEDLFYNYEISEEQLSVPFDQFIRNRTNTSLDQFFDSEIIEEEI